MEIGKENNGIQVKPLPILISERNIEKYGFGCFYYPDETNLQGNYWHRMIKGISPKGSAGSETELRIPGRFLVPLSRGSSQKLIHRKNFYVDQVYGRIKPMKLLSKRAGWNQTEEDLKRMIPIMKNSNFLAKIGFNEHEIPLGSGAVLNIGNDIDWIGMILVHPEVRRQGIATALMYYCLKFSRINRLKSIVGLDATPEGKKLYDRLGFKDSFHIWRCVVSTYSEYKKQPRFSIDPLSRFSSIKGYLLQRGFDERHAVFRLLLKLSSGKCFAVRTGNHITGIVMSRPGNIMPYIGPVIADNKESAAAVISEALACWKARNVENVIMDVPSYHLKAVAGENKLFEGIDKKRIFPLTSGFSMDLKLKRSFIRMYHLVTEKNIKPIVDFITRELNNTKINDEIKEVLNNSEKYHKETMDYMEKEKKDLIRFLYAIGGPEFS